MNPGPALLPGVRTPGKARLLSRGGWYAVALLLGAIFWLLGWYWDTGQSIVAIWERSETFAHGYLIVPISVWLIWRRRHEFAALELRPNFLVLMLLALVGFVWLLGELAGAGVVRQYGLVLMIPLLVWTVLGNQVVRALAFPLFFLLLAVPFGEFLTPTLIEHTADALIFALRMTNIPVYREGTFLTLSSGNWSVVEACSGLRYLIASVTLGFLYAYLTYRSLLRRVVFVAFSVIVPIVANWMRAYMIVMIGHLSGMKYAVGVDHLIYGWVFFGLVMLILFWIGSRWREDLDPRQAAPDAVVHTPRAEPSLTAIMSATIAAAVVMAIWPLAASRVAATGPYRPPALHAPAPAGAWQPVAGQVAEWRPRFYNPGAQFNQTYARDAGSVGLYIGYYRNQRQGAALISTQNTLVSGGQGAWANTHETRRTLVLNHEKVPLIETKLRGKSMQLLVWHWYWVDGEYTVNPYKAKLLQAKARLLGHGDDGAVIIVYTETHADVNAAAARMQDFGDTMLPGIARSLDNAR